MILLYFGCVSIWASVLTIIDKNAAIKNKWRIKEKTLFGVSALGGATAMLITMLCIRHKTKHKKFMLGLPIIILLQAIVIVSVMYILRVN